MSRHGYLRFGMLPDIYQEISGFRVNRRIRMSKTFPIYTVDSFTQKRFHGNPAAVCILDEPREPEWKQSITAEMNLSETAFLLAHPIGWDLSWFTPKIEVDLCGHATLASAHILWETGRLQANKPAVFATRSGILTCHRRGTVIEMDFPAEPPQETKPLQPLLDGLGVQPRYVGKNRLDYLVQLESEEQVRKLTPDIALLDQLPARGVIVTAQSAGKGYDFVSRFFAPQCGVPEDPVCGSAHCCLGPFWQSRLGKTQMIAHQVSARGGVIHVEFAGDRVILGGHAVTIMRGEILE